MDNIKEETLNIEIVKEMRMIKYIFITRRKIILCSAFRANELFENSERKAIVLVMNNEEEAKNEYEKYQKYGVNFEKLFDEHVYKYFLIKNKCDGKFLYHFDEKTINLFQNEKYDIEKMQTDVYIVENEDNTIEYEVSEERKLEKKKIEKDYLVLTDDRRVFFLKELKDEKVFQRIMRKIESCGIKKYAIKEITEKEKILYQELSLEELYRLEANQNILWYSREEENYIMLEKKGEYKIVKGKEKAEKEVSGIQKKDEYSFFKCDSLEKAVKQAEELHNIRNSENLFVDASFKKGKMNYRVVKKDKEIFREKICETTSKSIMTVAEFMAIYSAAEIIFREGYDKNTIIYSDSIDAITLLKELYDDNINYMRKIERYFATERKMKDNKMAIKLAKAIAFFKKHEKVNVKLWNQKEMGTNPAHFKVY